MVSPFRIPLSVLDLVPLGTGQTSAEALGATVKLARSAESLGFERVWYAEHHNMPGIASTSPEILIAHVAAATAHVRLGAGGVMLPNHAPLKVAEAYRLLEALHPGRIDLGIGRAPGTDPWTASALRRTRGSAGVDNFPNDLADLRGWGHGTLPPEHPFTNIRAMPDDVALPPIWLLGSSSYSAKLAGELGLGFAFAGHFSPDAPAGPMKLYRQAFRPGALKEPHAILALAVFAAETHDEAARMASSIVHSFVALASGKPDRLASPEEALRRVFSPEEEAVAAQIRHRLIVGKGDAVSVAIEAIARECEANEVMIATHAYEAEARLRSFDIVARALSKR